MTRKLSLLCSAIFMALLVWTAGGCGGGGASSGKPVVYLDGNLHGELATEIAKQAELRQFHDTETDGTVIVSLVEGKELDASTEAGLKAAYEAGQVVAINHANENEVRDFLDAIGLVCGYSTPEDVSDPEDKNVEIFAVVKSGEDVLTYTTHTDHHPTGLEDILVSSGDYEADDTEIIKDVSEDMPEGSSNDISVEELNADRTTRFFDWISSKDSAIKTLAAGKKSAAVKISASSGGDDITKIASAHIERHDCSELGRLMQLEYTIYSCHNFETGEDWYLVIQSGNMNPSKVYTRYHKKSGQTDPDKSNDALLKSVCGWNFKSKNHEYVVAENYALKYYFRNYILGSKNNTNVVLSPTNQSPITINKNHTTTVGMNWNLGGQLGLNPSGPSGSLSSGVSYSSSRSITTSDYNIENDCGNAWLNESQWSYIFSRPGQSSHNLDYRGLHEASDASRLNFIPVNEWVWSVSKPFRDSNMQNASGQCFVTDFHWESGKTIGAFGGSFYMYEYPRIDATIDVGSDSNNKDRSWKFFSVALPLPPRLATDQYELQFNKSDSHTTINVLSEMNWTAEAADNWCTVGPNSEGKYSGTATGKNSFGLLVEVDANDTGKARETKITIRDVNGETVRTIRVTQSRTD